MWVRDGAGWHLEARGTRVGYDEEIKRESTYDRCCDCGVEAGVASSPTQSPRQEQRMTTRAQRNDLFVNIFF